MSGRRGDPAGWLPLAVVALGLAVAALVSKVAGHARGLRHSAAPAGVWLLRAVPFACAAAVLVVLVLSLRWWLTRRTLRSRARFALVPSDSSIHPWRRWWRSLRSLPGRVAWSVAGGTRRPALFVSRSLHLTGWSATSLGFPGVLRLRCGRRARCMPTPGSTDSTPRSVVPARAK